MGWEGEDLEVGRHTLGTETSSAKDEGSGTGKPSSIKPAM
jgi:hypothetical protein